MTTVLLLEDDPLRIEWFEKMNTSADTLKVTVTADECIKALTDKQAAEEGFDLILLDHDLGGQVFVQETEYNTGSTVVGWLIENKEHWQNTKILVHSMNPVAGESMANRLNDAGFTDIRRHPFTDLKRMYHAYERSR
jgi:CheY-like chemotaxis protein